MSGKQRRRWGRKRRRRRRRTQRRKRHFGALTPTGLKSENKSWGIHFRPPISFFEESEDHHEGIEGVGGGVGVVSG